MVTKKTTAKKGLSDDEKWAVGELILVIKNDKSLYYHLYSNWYNTYAKRKARVSKDPSKEWSKEKAIKGLSGTFCSQCITFYNKNYAHGYAADKITLSKAGKEEFGKRVYTILMDMGLRNVKKGSKPREHANPTLGTRDNFWSRM